MWLLSRPKSGFRRASLTNPAEAHRESRSRTRPRPRLETLEFRNLLSAAPLHPPGLAIADHVMPAQQLASLPSIQHSDRGVSPLVSLPTARAQKQPNFSISQEKSFLPGKWRVFYTPSSLFGPGAQAAQEITFTGPKGSPTFISTTGVEVQGLVGPAYYQFSSWGYYQFLNKNSVRLTITGGSPTEYLNNGIIVPGGETVSVQFQSKNQFSSDGEVYTRIPLNSTIFAS